MRFSRFWCLIWLLILFGCKSSQVATDAAASLIDRLVVLQVNDVYEIAPIQGGAAGGLARVATLKQQLDTTADKTYLVMAGDFLSPSVIGTVKLDGERIKGAQMIDVMNAAGFDFVVFGNHEFDLEEGELQARIDASKFDWVAGNVQRKTGSGIVAFTQLGQPLPTSYVMTVPRAEGTPLQVGVISVCLPANQKDYVYYQDVLESAATQWRELMPRTDFIVAATHQAIEQDRELARHLPGLKLIMGGHEHENHFEVVEGVPIAKADANARTAYVHRFTFNRLTGEVDLRSELKPIGPEISEDSAVAARVADWEQKAYAAFEAQGLALDSPVVTLAEPLDGLETHIRTQPTNLGEAIAQAMYAAWDSVDCALANSGMVRIDDYLQGEITQFDLVRALPFGGQVLRVKMTGKLLQQVLQTGQANRGSGGYLQTYGVSERDGQWYVDGQPLQTDRVYSVAMGDFLLTGLEQNMDFLTRENPQVLRVDAPAPESLARDIRLALAEYLKNR